MPNQYTWINPHERFWSKVDCSGGADTCWLWTAGTTSDGYGKFAYEGKSRGAHIVSWVLTRGAIPDGLFVCHNCPGGDNRLCVNPAHLWLGSNLANLADRDAKGRQPIGTRNGRAKLTENDVREIRRLADAGVFQREIGRRFGVSHALVSFIVQRRQWRHVA